MNNLIKVLCSKYNLKNPKEIEEFLTSNRDLVEPLVSAPEYIHNIFGDVPIYLELHRDPKEGWGELFIVIKSNYPPNKVVELENKLFEEWFIKVINKVKGRLNYTEEPV